MVDYFLFFMSGVIIMSFVNFWVVYKMNVKACKERNDLIRKNKQEYNRRFSSGFKEGHIGFDLPF